MLLDPDERKTPMNMEVRGCAIYDPACHEFNPDGTSVMKKSFYHVVIDRAKDGPAKVTCGHEHATAEEARECLGALQGANSEER